MEDTMKALLSTAGALALIATTAAANPPGDRPVPNDNSVNFNNAPSGGSNNPTVVLKAKVFEYIAVWGTNDASATLDVAGVTGTGGVNDNDGSANAAFNVTTNVAHDITLSWDTWDHGGGTQADYRHTDDSCSIGGTVNLDTNPGTTGGIETAESGNGSLLHEGANPTWMKAYGIAAEVRPNVTDCTGDIAKPGEYQLGVDITVSKAS
jgi:hypothetical protein